MRISALVTSVVFGITCLFVLPTCLRSQDRGGTSPGTAATLIGGVFNKADASGSLEYWGVCNYHEVYPDFPKLRAVSDREGSPVELLREMFTVDPEMRVSQDADGKIRMIENDVPSDVLDVKLHFIRFGEYHGPNAAVVEILHAPELTAFRKEHNIGPEAGMRPGFGLPSEAFAPEKPRVLGDLEDVTVRQALDYILQTFHGYWLYESCKTAEGGRTMYLGFSENLPKAVPNQTKNIASFKFLFSRTACDAPAFQLTKLMYSNLTPINPVVANTYSNSLKSSLPHIASPFWSHIRTFSECPSNDTWQFLRPKHLETWKTGDRRTPFLKQF